jgi:hypothetical protein
VSSQPGRCTSKPLTACMAQKPGCQPPRKGAAEVEAGSLQVGGCRHSQGSSNLTAPSVFSHASQALSMRHPV